MSELEDPDVTEVSSHETSSFVADLRAAVERLPVWLKPAVFGPAILLSLVLLRGGILVIPVVIFLIFTAPADLGAFAALFGLLLAAAAVGGLLYGVIGRPLRQSSEVGRYPAGVLAVAPYIAGIVSTRHYFDQGGPLLAAWSRADLWIFVVVSLVFGTVVGHTWLGDTQEKDEQDPSSSGA